MGSAVLVLVMIVIDSASRFQSSKSLSPYSMREPRNAHRVSTYSQKSRGIYGNYHYASCQKAPSEARAADEIDRSVIHIED